MKNIKNDFLLVLLLFILISSCKKDEEVDVCDVFQWSYEGDSGQDYWSTCITDCGGQTQSPVDITDAVLDTTLPPLSIAYENVPIDLTNNGHTIEFEYEPGSNLSFEGIQYELIQFHFHTLSEHSVAGHHFMMEAHLVHKDTLTGNLIVIGVLFERTENENPFLQHFINDLPDEKDEHFSSAEIVNVNDLLPLDRHYYTYNGSLTTPPCSEIATWIVMKTPVEISISQLLQFTNIMHQNNRFIQPLNGRVIKESN